MQIRSLLCASAVSLAAPAWAADFVTKPSPHSVDATIDRLERAVGNAGATVFARVDHAKGAESVGATLPPAQMLMFGNPQLGTPAMQAAITAGLDLPLRVLAYQDSTGQVLVIYHDPASLAQTHGLPADADVLKKMSGALGNLTDAAVAAE